ncbi:MAG: hypothetical protein ABS75_23500 [Pelagibacterium sp. SCN 63-23]|nr:MAG: hypothetical protein ABS75_23500 [Pelagibacterium sp. SCN 63-23]
MKANIQPVAAAGDQIGSFNSVAAAAPAGLRGDISVRVSHRIDEVEAIWRQLGTEANESPGQSYDFIRLFVANRGIAPEAQFYVVGEVDGVPVALLPLHRKRVRGVRVYTWFAGAQVGCYAPIADLERLTALGVAGRTALWRHMLGRLKGADLVYLRSIPALVGGREGLFDELGSLLCVETLYRAEFSSWEQCDREQRSRSRRKHDRQQGERLAGLGSVDFEEVRDPAAAHDAIDVMFRQRSARFRAQHIRDAFVSQRLTRFYHDAIRPGSGIEVRLYVLRLDGAIVAVRYNVVHGGRMFCLISSMSDDARIQTGSPGKQCLLRMMQNVFNQGLSGFDMGAGLTDEKRHWCNVRTQLCQHYVGLSPLGHLVVSGHRAFQRLRAWAKANPAVKAAARHLHLA